MLKTDADNTLLDRFPLGACFACDINLLLLPHHRFKNLARFLCREQSISHQLFFAEGGTWDEPKVLSKFDVMIFCL